MEKELIVRVSCDIYETYYGGNQICICKDDDGYYVQDCYSGFSSQIYRTKKEAVVKLRSHLKQYYTTTKSNTMDRLNQSVSLIVILLGALLILSATSCSVNKGYCMSSRIVGFK